LFFAAGVIEAKGFEHLFAVNLTQVKVAEHRVVAQPIVSIASLRQIQAFNNGAMKLPPLDPQRCAIDRIVDRETKDGFAVQLTASFVEQGARVDKDTSAARNNTVDFLIPLYVPPAGWEHFGTKAIQMLEGGL
jgi:hypothetical protein